MAASLPQRSALATLCKQESSTRSRWRLLGSASEALFKSPECALLKKHGPFSVVVCLAGVGLAHTSVLKAHIGVLKSALSASPRPCQLMLVCAWLVCAWRKVVSCFVSTLVSAWPKELRVPQIAS